jgi:hypothetical protein
LQQLKNPLNKWFKISDINALAYFIFSKKCTYFVAADILFLQEDKSFPSSKQLNTSQRSLNKIKCFLKIFERISLMISARTSLTRSKSAAKIALYTSILRASIIGTINPLEMLACDANTLMYQLQSKL